MWATTMRTIAFASLLCLFLCTALSSGTAQTDELTQAINQSKITAAGSPPFHLKAVIGEQGKKDPAYKAEVEEFWAAPDKWRRTIKSSQFSQTLIVNGDKVSEQHLGDYYPFWLRDLVTAVFDLEPEDFSQVKKTPAKTDDLLSVPLSQGSAQGTTEGGFVRLPSAPFVSFFTNQCFRNEEKVGIPPVQNKVFRSFCTFGDMRLLTLLRTPRFQAQFLDYNSFKQKQVARRIVLGLEPGTIIEAKITELSEPRNLDDSLFAVQPAANKPPPPSVRIEETEARKMLLNSPDITWAPVREGKTSGVLSLVAYVDTEGQVRETLPLNSDSPFVLDHARKEVSKWRFQPLLRDGVPVQMETLLTLPFKTEIVNPIPVLSDKEARKMVTVKVEPKITSSTTPKGTQFIVRITVNEQGYVVGYENIQHVNDNLFSVASSSLRFWHFKPYKVNGKVERFSADITLRVQ